MPRKTSYPDQRTVQPPRRRRSGDVDAGAVEWRVQRRGLLEVWRPTVPPAVLAAETQTYWIAYADIGALFDAGGDLRRLETLTPTVACAIASVIFERRGTRRRFLKVRLRDKAAAFEKLLRDTPEARAAAAKASRSDERKLKRHVH